MPRSWLANLSLASLVLSACGEPLPRTEVAQVWAGGGNTCATTTDGYFWCWGGNWALQVGDGAIEDRNRPVMPAGMLRDVKFVSIGAGDTCAIGDQHLLCWGGDSDGSMLVGQPASVPAPQAAMPDPVTQVATSSSARCVQKTEGAIWCWGMGRNGNLGNGADADSAVPVLVTSMSSGVAAIVPLMYARKDDGSVWGWGPVSGANMNEAQVGHLSEPVPIVGVDLTPLVDVVQISTADRWGCALADTGKVLCWGSIPGAFERIYVDVAVEVNFPEIPMPIREIAVGADSVCLLDGDAAVWCWGSNQYGQLGGDASDPRFGLAAVRALPKPATHIVSGGVHACAILEDKTLWCWGYNGAGQLGVGDTNDRPRPTQVAFPG